MSWIVLRGHGPFVCYHFPSVVYVPKARGTCCYSFTTTLASFLPYTTPMSFAVQVPTLKSSPALCFPERQRQQKHQMHQTETCTSLGAGSYIPTVRPHTLGRLRQCFNPSWDKGRSREEQSTRALEKKTRRHSSCTRPGCSELSVPPDPCRRQRSFIRCKIADRDSSLQQALRPPCSFTGFPCPLVGELCISGDAFSR